VAASSNSRSTHAKRSLSSTTITLAGHESLAIAPSSLLGLETGGKTATLRRAAAPRAGGSCPSKAQLADDRTNRSDRWCLVAARFDRPRRPIRRERRHASRLREKRTSHGSLHRYDQSARMSADGHLRRDDQALAGSRLRTPEILGHEERNDLPRIASSFRRPEPPCTSACSWGGPLDLPVSACFSSLVWTPQSLSSPSLQMRDHLATRSVQSLAAEAAARSLLGAARRCWRFLVSGSGHAPRVCSRSRFRSSRRL